MVTQREIDHQLKAIGAEFRFWNKPEIKELKNILVHGERIMHCISGRYEAGFALLCATDQRLLLIDKKPFYLTLEDVRYDMIAEVDYSHRLLDSTMRIQTVNKTVRFTSYKSIPLRKLTTYLQNRIMEFRQQHMMQTAPTSPIYNLGRDLGGVAQYQHKAINPYTRLPLVMRRRVSRFFPVPDNQPEA